MNYTNQSLQSPEYTSLCGPTGDSLNCHIGWVSQPNQRGTLDIIWGCVLVLFVGVWAVLHLNVPALTDTYWSKVFRKARWSILAVLSPEILSLFASMQWAAARDSLKEMHEIGDTDWTIVHAYFTNMGGFLLKPPDMDAFPINAASLHWLRVNGWVKPPKITRDEIWDRSKADKFAKVVALTQISWLVLSSIARTIQHFDVSPMEIFTLAFTVCTSATAYFWMDKPQNVDLPAILELEHEMKDIIRNTRQASTDWHDTPMDFIEKPLWEQWERRPSLQKFGGLQKSPLEREPDDYAPPPPRPGLAVAMWMLSAAHAGVHVAGWNYAFATVAERMIWRCCSMIMLGVVILGGFIPVLSTRPKFDYRINLFWIWVRQIEHKRTLERRWLFDSLTNFGCALYLAARLCLIFEVCYSFHSLPATTYACVDWTKFLPHI